MTYILTYIRRIEGDVVVMAITSVDVDKAKIEEAKRILSAGSAREAIDMALDVVLALNHQQAVLDEMKAHPMTAEQRRATVIDYPDSDTSVA
ncbi:hypothetical protein GCM10009715_02270 [Paeniglutamicibacter psychrophenolicus]